MPNRNSLRINAKYLFLSFLSLSLFLFVLLITENGFSWDSLCASVGLLAILSLFLGINFVVTSKTTEYLNKHGYSSDTLGKIRQIGKTTEKSDGQENSGNGK